MNDVERSAMPNLPNRRRYRSGVVVAMIVGQVCTAIVHSILFARVLGPVVPSEGHVQSLDVYYVSEAKRNAFDGANVCAFSGAANDFAER